MKPSDETLMAYADGELGPTERAEVEAAMVADPEVARRVARHKALRKQVGTAFDGTLKEPVPERLIRAVWTAPAARSSGPPAPNGSDGSSGTRPYANKVTHLAQARAARSGKTQPRWSWPQLGAIAAALVIGALLGPFLVTSRHSPSVVAQNDGRLVAQGVLDSALSTQLASVRSAENPVTLGPTFRARSGEYCRTFVLQEGSVLSGFACRAGDSWQVRMLTQTGQRSGTTGWRMANTEIPAMVLKAVEDEITGDALDARDEELARDRGWR